MVKSADSGQIAKARELRERAEKEYIKQFGYGAQKGIPDLMARFAASERQAVIEECAKIAENLAKEYAKASKETGDYQFGKSVAASSVATAIRSME